MRKLNPVTLDHLKYENQTQTRIIAKDEPDRSRTPSMVLAVVLFLVFMIKMFVQGV